MKKLNDNQILFGLKKDLENSWKTYKTFLEKCEKSGKLEDYEKQIFICYMEKIIDLEEKFFELGHKIREREILSEKKTLNQERKN